MTNLELKKYFKQFKTIPIDQPFSYPEDVDTKKNWNRKLTPSWALPENREVKPRIYHT